MEISQEEKHFIIGILCGIGVIMLLKNNRAKNKGTTTSSTNANSNIVLVTPSSLTWSDFNDMILDKNNILAAYTNAQLVDESNKAHEYLINSGWINAFEKYASSLPQRTYGQMIMFALNTNGGYKLGTLPTPINTALPPVITTTSTTTIPVAASPVCDLGVAH